MTKFCLHIAFFVFGLLLHISSYAQLQDNNWCMGDGAGVSFLQQPPVGFSSQVNTIEATASVSDRNTGNLLFYTDGYSVWDATHTIMPNGRAVGGDSTIHSAAQGAVIVPFINDDNRYYVFTITAGSTVVGALDYSVVDMRLNNGKGDVVPAEKHIQLGLDLTEGMVAAQGCNTVWLITQKRMSSEFYVYKITSSGIDPTPVISKVNIPTAYGMSSFKVSPDAGTLIALGNILSLKGYMALNSFDKLTGKVTSNGVISLDGLIGYYDCEFSENGERLYVAADTAIFQYDMTQPGMVQIAQSKTQVKSIYMATGLQRRSDGDIYVAKYTSMSLDKISQANNLPPACVYTENAVAISGTTTYRLPQSIVYPITATVGTSISNQKAICNNVPIVLRPRNNALQYTWQDGSSADSFYVTQPGVYFVQTINSTCEANVDSFRVEGVNINVTINADSAICDGATLTLKANSQPAGTAYAWSNGGRQETTTIADSGRYGVEVSYNGCTASDEVYVAPYPHIYIELGSDTQICRESTMQLPYIASSAITDTYLWQDGSTGRTFNVTQSGKYYVSVTNQCETITDSITITGRNCHLYFPNAFTPNNDGLNDYAGIRGDISALSDYTLNIYNRWGQLVYTTHQPIEGWNGRRNGIFCDMGTYYYLVQYKYKGEQGTMKGDLTLLR